jgi:hypothetical protein
LTFGVASVHILDDFFGLPLVKEQINETVLVLFRGQAFLAEKEELLVELSFVLLLTVGLTENVREY